MHSFKLLPHTADIRLEVRAGSLEDVFKAALQGMCEIMKTHCCTAWHEHPNEAHIIISATDSTGLLIDFLSEVLPRSHLEKALFCAIRFTALTDRKLEGVILGCRQENWDEEIKAVTYHEAALARALRGQWCTTIIFDI